MGLTYSGRRTVGVKMPAFVDSDNATSLNTRRSVSGGAVLLEGAAISWFSRT